jgi:hypothetical protein
VAGQPIGLDMLEPDGQNNNGEQILFLYFVPVIAIDPSS